MHIILVNPRGFCAGVRMAIEVVDRVLDLFPDETIYVYHEIVHNRHVVGRFRDRGVVFVDDIDEVPAGRKVIFSAHGVSPEVRARAEARGVIAIDATCPLVTKVHSEAVRYARKDWQILLIGHANHQEIVGTLGEAPEATQVVEKPEDLDRIPIKDPEKVAYLTQTTLSTDDAAVIIDAIRHRLPNVHEPPSSDICYATTNRQQAVRELAPRCDVVLVVGSANSSNSVRLTEIAQRVGTRAHLIDDVHGLDDAWFETGNETVLLTAGASAPEDLVAGICRKLLDTFGGTLEQADVYEEDIEFDVPATLKRLTRQQGIDPGSQHLHVSKPVITRERYGAVPLTISAPKSQGRWLPAAGK